MAGMRKVVKARIKQTAAIPPTVNMIGILALKIANIGFPICESFSSVLIYSAVMVLIPEKKMAKKMVAAISSR